ncbi:HlyD family type I secretion periplasmic adaptor subunit [Paracoccus sp. WLY502]|uniref:HlyD family type I secretion periplasmic adaptor subunit n=1 Tax=Paracoccus yibinensis TaxID=3068891 RepID=UPI0027964DE3|nr:HlyD family type I secretion periplasmic adaptor subunit [Paracoccus sp. WLY502]MDQ1901618.1 HlyD family type I secretion periplasmic adaptor subunit [Paracoccus sp. WLY502]
MTAPGEASPADAGVGPPFGVGLTLCGFAIVALFCGAFAAWSMLAPIEGGVVAPGVLAVESNVRTVQHLEGGIVQEILVQEGDTVEAGDILIRLGSTHPTATLNEMQAQYFEARATEARLIAERDGLDRIDFPAELRDKVGDQAVQSAMAGQESIFASRRSLLRDRLDILERTQSALTNEVKGLEGQIGSAERQLALIEEELATASSLLDRGLTEAPRVLALRRTQAELEGTISQHRAAIGVAQQRSEEALLRMAELRTSMANEVEEQLREMRTRAYELGQRLAAAQDVLDRTTIRSPIAGTVVGLGVHTVGGVIGAGQPLLDVVPLNDKLVVQATIDPLDIDQVTEGLPATIWLSALNRRTQTGIEGRVQTVSADRLTDPRTGLPYYLARVEMEAAAVERSAVPLQAGMSADVMIKTGARTVWDYLSAPIVRSLSFALRES